MVHAITVLWRLHRVNHADRGCDLINGSRFHPIEVILSMVIKFLERLLIGPAVIAVLIFGIFLNGMAMFNHANIRLPDHVDRLLRLVVVTPDTHRLHHSVDDDETNSNFGFNLSWRDRLFGTYRDQTRAGHEGMTIRLRGFREARDTNRWPGMVMLPFRGPVDGYTINRRTSSPPNHQDRRYPPAHRALISHAGRLADPVEGVTHNLQGIGRKDAETFERPRTQNAR